MRAPSAEDNAESLLVQLRWSSDLRRDSPPYYQCHRPKIELALPAFEVVEAPETEPPVSLLANGPA